MHDIVVDTTFRIKAYNLAPLAFASYLSDPVTGRIVIKNSHRAPLHDAVHAGCIKTVLCRPDPSIAIERTIR